MKQTTLLNLNGMEYTGVSMQHKGKQYECQECGAVVWSAYGQAKRHPKHCPEQ